MPMVFDRHDLYGIFRQQVILFPERPYCIKEHTITYQEAHDQITRLATALLCRNTDHHPVILHIRCHQQWLLCWWACIRAGLDVILPPDILPSDQPHAWLLDEVALGALQEVSLTGLPAAVRPSDIYFYSSGTTGMPKLIGNTSHQLVSALQALYAQPPAYLRTCRQVYLTPPLFHSYGLSAMLEYTMMGATIILPPERGTVGPVKGLFRKDIAAIVDSIEGVPYFYTQLNTILPRLQLPALQHVGFGGDAVPDALLHTWQAKFPAVSYSVRYGVTEIPSVVCLQEFTDIMEADTARIQHWLSIYNIYLQHEPGDEATGTGELYVDYLTASGEKITVPTGDIAMATGDHFRLEGRRKSFFKYKGFKINPLRIESVIKAFNGVKEAKVFLTAQARLKAEFEADSDVAVPALKAFLAATLPDYMLPDELTRVDNIPRTASGKIIRHIY
ncbi:acyl--CoA ligase [Chitinophaga pendula]|uniref:class I adenylate-forming enzyme family protein n=1 Tax=Chitinophaga TaxID=79328 RepID=UPI000BAF9B25|nr:MULTISPECIES: class I adenylate-forming enzyme family protein [Chitinophaga]ASZ09695.1 hypothetical protein CK934_01250 [Chitinophaga sp. MD30]UCJ07365.1 acyl--CoA ligase [Chitinophaga pendula]